MAKTKKAIDKQIQEILARPYAWVVTPEEGGGFSGEILEFPGCFACGDTAREVYDDLRDAAFSWLECQIEKGEAIPPPLTTYDSDGRSRFALRLSHSAYARAAKAAVIDGVGLNQFISDAVAEKLGRGAGGG